MSLGTVYRSGAGLLRWLLAACIVVVFAISAARTSDFREPSYDHVRKLSPLRPVSKMLIGTGKSQKLFQTGLNGSVGAVGGVSLQFAGGYPFVRFGRKGNTTFTLIDGFYPAPVVTWRYGGITYEETVYTQSATGHTGPAAFVRLRVKNEAVTKASLPLFAFLADTDEAARDGQMPRKPRLKYPLSFDKGCLTDADGNIVLLAPSVPKPEYQPLFAGAGFVQAVEGPVLTNPQRRVLNAPSYNIEFKFDGKEIKLLGDSLDTVGGETIPSYGFDLLVRSDKQHTQPILLVLKLNGKSLGYIGKQGFKKEPSPAADFLQPGASSAWVSWDIMQDAAISGQNSIELTAVTSDQLVPIDSWRPLAALLPSASRRPSEVLWPGDNPGEEWARGLFYPHDTLVYRLEIDPKECKELLFYLPASPAPPNSAVSLNSAKFDLGLQEMKKEWDTLLTQAVKLNVPMPELNNAWYSALSAILARLPEQAKYAEPWLDTALDLAGFADIAERRLDSRLASKDIGGLGRTLGEAVRHYRLTGRREWIEKHLPDILDGCERIVKARNEVKNADGSPKIPGILGPSKLPYTGELTYQCGFADAWAYWGLRSAAITLKELGRPEADKLLAEAEDYRQDIIANTRPVMPEEMEAASFDFSHYRPDGSPNIKDIVVDNSPIPFVPLGPEMRVPGFYGGYAVRGPVNLIIAGIDGPESERADWIMGFVEKYMMVCEKVGGVGMPLGVPCWTDNIHDPMYRSADPSYAAEYALAYLYRDEVEKFVSAFYTLLALNKDIPQPDTKSALLMLLRNLLVHEDGETLRICQAVPREWLESGKKIEIENAPTDFGPVSFALTSELVADRMVLNLTPPARKIPKEIIIRFRHPRGQEIRAVELDGQAYSNFKGEEVILSAAAKPLKIVVRY